VKVDHFINYISRPDLLQDGLDNITAEGTEAFDGLMSIIETLMENGENKHWAQTMRETLKTVSR